MGRIDENFPCCTNTRKIASRALFQSGILPKNAIPERVLFGFVFTVDERRIPQDFAIAYTRGQAAMGRANTTDRSRLCVGRII
jgi:hypothetical protein